MQQVIEKNIDQFFVFEIDENFIVCVLFYFYFDKLQVVEVGLFYVLLFYYNCGIGWKMVDYVCMMVKECGVKIIVVFLMQSYFFFMSVFNFEEMSKDIFFEVCLKMYEESGCNLKVLVKQV